MIDTKLDAGLENVVRLLRAFGERYLRPAGLEADRSGEPLPVGHSLFTAFSRLGFRFGMMESGRGADDASGSKGEKRGARTGVLAAEELAFWDQGVCMSLPGPGLGGGPMALLASPAQKQKYLKAAFADPDKPAWGAYALTEPGAGSDVAAIRSTARRDGDEWVINGEKMFITNGARASWVVWFATVDPGAGRAGHRAFIVEAGTPGYSVSRVEKKMGLTASETAGLVCADVRVPAANLLGGDVPARGAGDGFKVAMATFDLTRPMVAAMAVGIGRCAWQRARDVAREAFGQRPRATREVLLLDRLARARRRLDAARLLCWRAAWKIDLGEPNTIEASMAKIYAPRAALDACAAALDVMDLAGAVDPLVEKCFRDVKIFNIFEGTGEVQRIVLARRLLDYPPA
jgi:acyl-CoA dehydrogenase